MWKDSRYTCREPVRLQSQTSKWNVITHGWLCHAREARSLTEHSREDLHSRTHMHMQLPVCSWCVSRQQAAASLPPPVAPPRPPLWTHTRAHGRSAAAAAVYCSWRLSLARYDQTCFSYRRQICWGGFAEADLLTLCSILTWVAHQAKTV